MAASMDTRIVQMQFDNKDFERDIKISDKSLAKFKENLDFSKCEKGLTEFGNAIKSLSFSGLVENVQKLTDKFTGLGNITEMVLSNIRRGIESTVSKISGLVNQLGFEQISAGKGKFEELNKNVQTIMAATGKSEEEVYDVMGRLNKYTDQTSYNFTDMASNIGKFTSVGIDLKSAEKQMEGIANWAARSGAGIQEASRAMYNLSQAMGVGKMTTMDWKSIENAGMATKEFKEQLIQAGLALGTLELDKKGNIKTAKSLGKQVDVNYQNLRETLSKGWANRQVMEKTLLGYYYDDLMYENEKAINLTQEQLDTNKKYFEDNKLTPEEWMQMEGLDAMTDEVKQKLIDIAVEQGNLVKTTDKNGKAVYKTAKQYGEQTEVTIENLKDTLSLGWVDKNVAGQIGLVEGLGEASYKAAQKCTTLTDVFNAWKDQLSTGWMKFWQQIFGNLSESMEHFSNLCNKVGESFDDFITTLVGDGEDIQGIFGTWGNLGGRDSLWSLFVGQYEGAYEGAYGLIDVITDVGGLIKDAIWSVIKIMNPELDNMSEEDWLSNEAYRTEYLGKRLKESIEKVKDFIQGIKDFMNAIPEGQTKSRFQMLQETVTGIFSIVGIVYKSIEDIFGFFTKLFGDDALGPVIDDIITIFRTIGNEISGTASAAAKGKGLKAFLDSVYQILVDSGFIDAVKSFSGAFKNLIDAIFKSNPDGSTTVSLWNRIIGIFSKLFNTVSKIATPMVNAITKIVNAIKKITNAFFEFKATGDIDTFKKKVKSALNEMINSIFSFTPNFTGQVKGIFSAIKNVFVSGFSKESIADLKKKFNALFGDFKKSMPASVKSTVKSIYDNIKKFVKDTWTKIKGTFSPLFADIKNVFTSGFSKESIEQLKTRFKTLFQSISGKIPDDVKTAFNNITAKIKSYFLKKIEKVKAFFSPLFNSIKNVFTSGFSKESLKQLATQFQTTWKSLSDKIPEGVKTSCKSIIEKVKKALSDLWVKIKEKVSEIFGFKKKDAEEVLDKDGKPVKGAIGTFFDNLKTWFGGFISGFSNDLKNANLFTLIKEKLGFGQLAAFMGGLSGIVKGTNLYGLAMAFLGATSLVKLIKLFKGGSTLFTTIGGFFTSAKDTLQGGIKGLIFGKEEKQTESFGDKLLKIAKGIALIVAAIAVLGLIPLKNLIQGVAAFAIIMGLILAFMWALKKLEKDLQQTKGLIKTLFGIGVAMLGITIGISILIAALKPIADMTLGQIAKMFVALIAILVIMAAFIKYVNKMENGLKVKGVLSIAALAIGIGIMVLALKPLADVSWEGLLKMGVGLIAIAGILLIFTKKAGFINGSGLWQLILVAAAIWVLVESLKPLANYSWEQLIKMGAALIVLVGVLGKFTQDSQSMKGTSMIQLLLVAGTIFLLLEALKPLANYSWEQLGKMGAGLVALSAVLIIMTKIFSTMNFQGLAAAGNIGIMIGAVLGAITGMINAIKPLADYEWAQLAKMGAGLILLTAVLVIMTRLIKPMGTLSQGLGTGVMMLSLAVVMSAFGSMLSSIKGVSWSSILAACVGLSLVLAVFIGLVTTLVRAKDTKKALSALIMMVGLSVILSAFGNALKSIKGIDPKAILAFSVALTLLIVGMAAAILILSNVNIAAGISGILLLVAGIIAVLGAVSIMIPLIMNAISSGLESMMAKLALVAGMFADFAQNMNDVSEGDLDSAKRKFEMLMDIVLSVKDCGSYITAIKDFEMSMLMLGNAVAQYMHSTQNVSDPSSNSGLAFVKEVLGLKEEFASFSIGNFNNDIANLGGALAVFGESVGGSLLQIAGGVNLISQLASQADNLDTLSKLSLDKLNENIAGLGGALSIYANGASEANGLNESDVPDIQKAVDLMTSVMNSLGADGGFAELPELPDESNLGEFGVQLAALAGAMTKFAQASQSLGDTSKAIELLGFLGELNSKLTEENLSVASRFGADYLKTDSLTNFGIQIAVLGASLSSFSEQTKDFVKNQNVEDALLFFEGLKDRLTTRNLSAILAFGNANVDEEALTRFGTEIGELGQALSSFAENVNFDDSTETKFKSAIEALNDLSILANSLPVIGGIAGFIHGNVETLGTMAGDIRLLGESLSQFSQELDNGETKFNSDLAKDAVEVAQAIADVAIGMASQDVDNIYDAYFYLGRLSEFVDAMNSLTDSSLEGGVNPLAQGIVKFMGSIQDAVDQAGGIKDASVFESFKNMAQGISALVNVDPSLDFTKVGDKISTGIIEGINAKTEEVKSAILTLINLGNIVGGNIDSDPTVTPVMDLSNVDAGARMINGLFNSPYNLAVSEDGLLSIDLAKASVWADGMLPENYSTAIGEVKDEITGMRDDLRTLSESMTRLKLVMNSGAVVGAIGPEMDEYLAEQGFYAARSQVGT